MGPVLLAFTRGHSQTSTVYKYGQIYREVLFTPTGIIHPKGRKSVFMNGIRGYIFHNAEYMKYIEGRMCFIQQRHDIYLR